MRFTSYVIIFIFFSTLFPSLSRAETSSSNFPLSKISLSQLSKDIPLKIGQSEYVLARSVFEKWIDEKTDLGYVPAYKSEIENSHYCHYKKLIVCSLEFSVRNEGHVQKLSTVTLDEKLIDVFLDDLERQANRDPENAKLQMIDGKISISSPGIDGVKLDKANSKNILKKYFQNPGVSKALEMAYAKTKPDISEESVADLKISTLLGEGRSNFSGSPKNRIFNINVATKRFDGILIKPGEEFSFVKILGPVDGEHGYLPELVIKQNKTEPEFGGGICQVSTTTFRAAIYSGLKITARKNHAYPVRYYNPQGMDATVYVPRPDLRFMNNTPGYILIQTKIEGTQLVFQFYGADDGRKTTIIGPTILERNPDGSMKTTFTQQVYDKDQNLIIEDVFNSNYASPNKFPHPGQFLTEKPSDWSDNEWEKYKKANNLP